MMPVSLKKRFDASTPSVAASTVPLGPCFGDRAGQEQWHVSHESSAASHFRGHFIALAP